LGIYALEPTTTFLKMFNTADMGWIWNTDVPTLNKVDPYLINDQSQPAVSALKVMTDTYWKKDIVFRTPSTGNCYLIYGQAEYATQLEAESAPLPTVPDSLSNVAVYLCSIVCQKESTTIGAGIKDIRPYLPRVFGFGSSSSGTTTSHSDLSNLSADDHTQYFNELRGDLRYAKLANGVTNGDAHDHSGGDGATISYNNLSDKPFIPTPVVAAKYVLNEAYTGLDSAQSLGALTTGIVKNTISGTVGTLSIAQGDTDYLVPNVAITPATGTKITADAQGLVTTVANATTADIADSTGRRYTTEAQQTILGNTSNTNSGDVTLATNNGLTLANQVIGMGTPSTITNATTNNVTGATHTHALTLTIPTDISAVPYIIKGTSVTGVTNAQAMGNLATGIVKNTITTGVQSIAQAGTDYVAPNPAITAGVKHLVSYDVKGLVTSGVAPTATDVNLGNVTNESKATMFTNPAFTGNPTGIKDSDVTFTDITTNNVDTTHHGYAPKLPGNTSTFLRGDGTYASVTAGAAGNTTEVQYNSVGALAGATGLTIVSNIPTVTTVANFTSTTDPVTPAAGLMSFYAKSIAGRMLPKFVGPSGLDSPLQPMLAMNKVAWWNPPGNATTVPGVCGMAAPTAVGTTTRTVATTRFFTRLKRLGYVSTTTAGALCGHYGTTAQFTMGGTGGGAVPWLGGFFKVVRFGISDAATVANAQMFVGISSTVAALTNVSPATLLNSIGIGHASASANMFLYYGGSAAQTPINLGVNFPKNTSSVDAYELILFNPPNSNNTVYYRVTRLNTLHVAEGTLTAATPGTQLPLNTTLLCLNRSWRTNGGTTSAVGLDIISDYFESDY